MFDDLQKMGILLNEFPEFGSLVKQSSADLASLGGTVRQGAKVLAASSAQINLNREALFRAGMTQEDINDATMSYLKLQTQLGRNTQAEIKDTVNLGESARAYLAEQNKLTMITGQDRKSREAARAAAMNEERFRAKMRSLELAGDTEGVKSMTMFNDVVQGLAPEVAQGARDMFAGNLTSEAAQKLQRSAPEAFATLQKLLAKTIEPAEAAQTILKQVQQTGDSIGTVLGQTGNFNSKFVSMSESADLAGKLQVSIVDRFKTADEEYKKQLDKATQNTADQAKINEGNRRLALGMQDIVTGVQPQLQSPNVVLSEAADAIAAQLKLLATGLKDYNKVQEEFNQKVAALVTKTKGDARTKTGKLEDARPPAEPPPAAQPPAAQPPAAPPPAAPPPQPVPPPVSTNDGRGSEGQLEPAKPPSTQSATPPANRAQQMQNIRNLIQRAEITPGAENPYDIQQGEGKKAAVELTKMTVDQVLALQDQRRKKGLKKGESTAVGAYQIVQGTLKEKIAQLKIQGDQMFDKDLQDQLADSLIKQAGYEDYAANPTPDAKKAFIKRLSGIWAGIPKDASGQTALPQNQNKATIDFDTAINSFGDGGIALRDQLARIGEKGPEAIIPLKNGSVPVTISAGGLLDSMAQPDIDPAKIEALGKNMSNNVGAEIRAALNDLKISLQATAQPRDDVNQQILAEMQDMTRMQKILVSSNQRIAQAAVN
jgi:muramidase (phage lysozyme)